MTSERIEEIQKGTAYPDSLSVKQALLQVWNETEQELKSDLIYTVSKLFLFKVRDYTTELIGRYNAEKDCYYVQRGDGSKYEYDTDRITWKRELNVC